MFSGIAGDKVMGLFAREAGTDGTMFVMLSMQYSRLLVCIVEAGRMSVDDGRCWCSDLREPGMAHSEACENLRKIIGELAEQGEVCEKCWQVLAGEDRILRKHSACQSQ